MFEIVLSASSLILLLFVAVVVAALILVEIFFVPGIGLFALLSALGIGAVAYYLVSQALWGELVLFALVVSTLSLIGFVLISRSGLLDRMSLRETIDGKTTGLPPQVSVGAHGTTLSRMTLGGRIQIGEEQVEAYSEEGFLDPDTPIYVSRIERNQVFVKRSDHS